MAVTGPVEGEPSKVGVAITDITTGLFACTAILAALHERERSGMGQYIDVALLDSQIAWLANVGQNYLATGRTPRATATPMPASSPMKPFHNGSIAVGVGPNSSSASSVRWPANPSWPPRSATRPKSARVANRGILIPLLQEIFRSRTGEQRGWPGWKRSAFRPAPSTMLRRRWKIRRCRPAPWCRKLTTRQPVP